MNELTNWVDRLEEAIPTLKDEPGHFIINPLSALKLADWCERFKKLEEKNRKLNHGESLFAVFDLETTGFHSAEQFADGIGGITDIGVSLLKNGIYQGNEVLEDGTQLEGENPFEFDSLCNPGVFIPDNVVELTGITNEMVSVARPQKDVLKDFRQFTKGAILVGHNIGDDQFCTRGFDVKRVYGPIAEKQFGDSISDLLANSIDTLPLFTNLISGVSHTNEEFGKRLGFKLVGAHRAIPDVRVNALCFSKLVPILLDTPVEELREHANKLLEKGEHIVTHIQVGAEVVNGELKQWGEFGIKLDPEHLKLPGRKRTIIIRYDFDADQFVFEETELKDRVISPDELADYLKPKDLERQSCILRGVSSFDSILEQLKKPVEF
ncbi:MAG: 3'-5' exonuclease [Parvimonas micra]|uniref:3'-5' exonuclease n=1 Tax=Parvimonas micra TaxID=33033 RepID=A0A930H2X3_9FIRM|nr:3'-5' exonuclease [Parvimonas micra]MBF1306216.1 3'-5' exonuclease [Parvimonas micra]